MKRYIFILLVFTISCSTKQNKPEQKSVQDTSLQNNVTEVTDATTEIIETFTDSLLIGEKGKSKIEIIKHRVFEENYVIIKFYTKGPAYWISQNTYVYECDAMMGLEPFISDFNHDSFNDITFVSATAARGGNEVRRLFIYKEDDNTLTSILNAQDFPNMQYNNELDCIDAFLIHGGTTTVFAKLENDSLIEFAGVNNSNHRTVYEINKQGKEKVLRRDSIIDNNDVYVRYRNYNPLKAYTK